MTNMFDPITCVNQFLTQRNWWQFHSPKNDSMNIMVEVGELAEHFVVDNRGISTVEIADELADVLFASFCFALLTKIDIANAFGAMAGEQTLKDSNCSYEQLQELVLQNLDKCNLAHLTAPHQVVLSLTAHASQLADIFMWSTSEQSIVRVKEYYDLAAKHLACIVAHLIFLARLLNINVPDAYMRKMQKNDAKYPVGQSSSEGYIKIKDRARGRGKK